jgi:D-arabinose 1-dehydrogenase-like Zn-dependent alcohol dehydrogenase
LCAGIIGFRSLRVAEVEHGERVAIKNDSINGAAVIVP